MNTHNRGLLAARFLVVAAGTALALSAVAADAPVAADKPAASNKDIGPVKPTKPQYDTGLKPKEEITAAEQMVFLDEHLANIKASATLTYAFTKQGSMEKGFSDSVEEAVT
ncbi:MAG: hypothetical protein EBV57_08565, partial [Betaproteobacteria bacterium]|nr:hypothetical protein [Betaproteobacteria bacterium]